MTDRNLTDLLERAANRTHVGAPPMEEMVANAKRRRRRRTVIRTAVASGAVAAIVGSAAVLSVPDTDPRHEPAPATSPSQSPTSADESAASTSITGTWTVRALVGPNGRSVLPNSAKHRVQLTFKAGQMTGTTGCNDVFGAYEQNGAAGQDLRFPRTQLGSTLVGCADEPPLVSRLLDVRHVSGSGNVRYLHAANWMIVAELRRS